MKKIISFVLAMMLVVSSMSVTAFAAQTGVSEGEYQIGVSGTYSQGAGVDDVISVDISWTEMTFSYTGGSEGTWNPAKHEYENGTDGSWTAAKAGITVRNHSNCNVTASFEFQAASGLNVTGTFYTRGEDNRFTALESDAQKLNLTTAVGTVRDDTNNKQDNTPKDTIYFCITGGSIDKSYNTAESNLGTITVNIAKYSN